MGIWSLELKLECALSFRLFAQVCRASSSTHSSLIVGGLVLILGWNEIVWLIYNPLYLILLIATSAGGGVYYFLNVGPFPPIFT